MSLNYFLHVQAIRLSCIVVCVRVFVCVCSLSLCSCVRVLQFTCSEETQQDLLERPSRNTIAISGDIQVASLAPLSHAGRMQTLTVGNGISGIKIMTFHLIYLPRMGLEYANQEIRGKPTQLSGRRRELIISPGLKEYFLKRALLLFIVK